MSKSSLAANAAVRLALRHPFWTEVFYSMTIREATPEEVATGIQTQATDGRNLWINADFWKGIPLDQQVAELVHELYHKILFHNTRRNGRDPYMWNCACDYVINAAMKKQGFQFPCSGNEGDWLYDPKYDGWLAESVYTDLMKKAKEQQPQDGSGKPGSGSGMKGQPGVPKLSPSREDLKDAQQCDSPEAKAKVEGDIKALVDRAIATAKAMGTLPAGIEANVAAATKAVKEPWYNHLHRFMQSLRSSQYNWVRLNRRALLTHGFFAPSHYSEAMGAVAIFIDTSGSCYAAAQQAKFADHLNAILGEAKPERIHIYYFDARVYPGEVVEAGEVDVQIKPVGGGGTRFNDLFTQLEEDGVEPEVSIVLTDLCGSFGEAPHHPVIWACTEAEGSVEPAPFGDTIYMQD